MPFSNKYSQLGSTEKIRIPKEYVPQIENILVEFNRIHEEKGKEYLIVIIDKFYKALKQK